MADQPRQAVILTPFFRTHTLFDGPVLATEPDLYHCACQWYEFFPLWYLYVRKHCPAEDLYIVDCGSPLPIEPILNLIHEPYEIINREDCYDLDPRASIHVKRYKQRLNHARGSSRTVVDYLKMCAHNNLDYVLIESDALVAYPIYEDFRGRDFVAQRIDRESGSILEGALLYISRHLIRERVQNGSLAKWFNAPMDEQSWDERDTYGQFARGRMAELSRPDRYIHKAWANEVKSFLAANPIDHPFVKTFLDSLDKRMQKHTVFSRTISLADTPR